MSEGHAELLADALAEAEADTEPEASGGGVDPPSALVVALTDVVAVAVEMA